MGLKNHPNFHAVQFATDMQIEIFRNNNKVIDVNKINELYLKALRNDVAIKVAPDISFVAMGFISVYQDNDSLLEFVEFVEDMLDQNVELYKLGKIKDKQGKFIGEE